MPNIVRLTDSFETRKRKVNKRKFCDKPKFVYRNDATDSEDESECPSIPGLPDIANMLKKKKRDVFREHNHIYFRCSVTMEKVNKLCNLIEEYNREQEAMRSELTTVILVPKPLYLHITSEGGDIFSGF